jgi:starch phosphorylase
MAFFGDEERIRRLSLIDEAGDKYVRMAHLASVGSHAINGVAALHTELLKSDVLRDFAELWPEKFSNKTNGVTPRRWMALSNPRLANCITQRIGDDWIRDLQQLRKLEPHAEDPDFRAVWRRIKHMNKASLAAVIEQRTGQVVNPDAIFDVQVKRIHEYKRQHLNILHVIGLYHRLKTDPKFTMEPRVFVFGGKAAPGYHLAKLIIRLITAVAEIINRDPGVRELIKVVYLPNFNVTNGQKIYPAADLSEQISTAGKEASGTGNMKFQMNGALTIGTVDGANIEICEEVGVENFFLFGLEAHEVAAKRKAGYKPMEFVEGNEELQAIIQLIGDGFFSRGNSSQFQPLIDNLIYHDPYFVLADYQSYADCQTLVDQTYRDKEAWSRMSILNSARSGKFSSDRTIREYCDDIWKATPVKVQLISQEEVKAGLVQ